MVTRAVFLDRDGVLNANVERDGRPVAPTRLEDFRLLPGVAASVKRLKAAGFLIVVATNQPDIANGRSTWNLLNAMHDVLCKSVAIDDIRVCPHVDTDGCECRKPRAGMLLSAAVTHGIELGKSYMVGDRWRDIYAGRAAGCCTILLSRDDLSGSTNCQPDFVAATLHEAVDVIARHAGISIPEVGT